MFPESLKQLEALEISAEYVRKEKGKDAKF
jgi:hypothetical protein